MNNKVTKLKEILCKRDDELLPKFYAALIATDQEHVARKLGYGGLCTLVELLISYI